MERDTPNGRVPSATAGTPPQEGRERERERNLFFGCTDPNLKSRLSGTENAHVATKSAFSLTKFFTLDPRFVHTFYDNKRSGHEKSLGD